VLNNLGYQLIERNKSLDEALQMIQRAVNAEPQNSNYLDSLGWAYFKLGKFDEAERYLTEAARLNQKSATMQEHLGDLYVRQSKMKSARAAWQKALSLSEDESDQKTRIRTKLNGLAKD